MDADSAEVPVWISRGDDFPRQLRLLDISPLGFNVWGFIKDQVC